MGWTKLMSSWSWPIDLLSYIPRIINQLTISVQGSV